MTDQSKWKNKNRDILKIRDIFKNRENQRYKKDIPEEIYNPIPTGTGPTRPPPPKLPKELKQNGKKLKRGGKV